MTTVPAPRIEGVRVLQPTTRGDDRGWFREVTRASQLADAGLPPTVQVNHSRSARGVLRGLHIQTDPPQAKLITCIRGTIFDVVVDLRAGSPTFLQWEHFTLSGQNGLQVYCPSGFAHGFQVISDDADVVYFCSDYFSAAGEETIAHDDPRIGVAWPDPAGTLSPRDRAANYLAGDWPGISVAGPPGP